MSHQSLHRVSVRMLFDPAFVEAVYADAELALRGLDLSAEERSWLLAVDRRAWQVDPQRRARSLKNLFDELPASTTLALAECRSLARLDAYFSSAVFHETMQGRGSMTLGFVRYLRGLGLRQPLFPEVLRLEEQLALCRRELESPPQRLAQRPRGPWVARAAGVGAGCFDGATLEAITTTERWLFAAGLMPALALAADAPGLDPLPSPQGQTLYLVFQPNAGGSGLRELGVTVAQVLQESERPVATALWLHRVAGRGLGPQRAVALLEDLRAEGLLTAGE